MFIGLPLNAEMGTVWAAAKLEALKAHLGLRSDNRWHGILREKAALKLSADRRRDVALLAMVALMHCVMGLHLWFWAVGYADLQRPSALGCGGTRSFFFASVPSYGWFRVLQLLFLALVAGAQELWLTALVLTKMFRSPRAPADSVGGPKYLAGLPAAQAAVHGYTVSQPVSAAQEERLLAALAPGRGVVAALWIFNLLGACFFVMSPSSCCISTALRPRRRSQISIRCLRSSSASPRSRTARWRRGSCRRTSSGSWWRRRRSRGRWCSREPSTAW